MKPDVRKTLNIINLWHVDNIIIIYKVVIALILHIHYELLVFDLMLLTTYKKTSVFQTNYSLQYNQFRGPITLQNPRTTIII